MVAEEILTNVAVTMPFPIEEVPRVFLWAQEYERACLDDSMPQTMHAFVEDWERSKRLAWAVKRDGEVGGVVLASGCGPKGADVECAHTAMLRVIFARRFWEEQTTKPAVDAAVAWLFAHGVKKVAWWPYAHASQLVALARATGFKREGTLHGHASQRGRAVDLALFGLWQGEREVEQNAFL